MRTTITMATAALLLAACGEAEAPTAPATGAGEASVAGAEMDHDGMDHEGMDHGAVAADGMTMGQGRVVAVESDTRVRIDHDAIEGAGMAAMTMTFEAMRDVALDGLDEGDEVHFLLDRGRDGTFRLAGICDVVAEDHEACMADLMAKR